jgi:hypothetical protein
MAKTKQFTISLENRPGALAEVVRTLGSAKVNILTLLGTAQGTNGSGGTCRRGCAARPQGVG